MKHLIVFAILILFAGCSWVTPPREKPIIEDKMRNKATGSQFGTLAVDATRRVVVMDLKYNKVCAEPPPDVAESLARSFSANLNASVKRGDLDASTQAALNRAYETAVKQLSPLSQGVKLGRDQLFALCQARSNWFLNNDNFYRLFNQIIVSSHDLVEREIRFLSHVYDDAQADLSDHNVYRDLPIRVEPPDDVDEGESTPEIQEEEASIQAAEAAAREDANPAEEGNEEE